jgi:hypothetical protein
MAARTAWTDDRIDDLVGNLTREMNGIRTDMSDFRADMRADMNSLRDDIRALNGRLVTVLLTVSVALIGAVGGLVATSL